jgi:hypothetical protein
MQPFEKYFEDLLSSRKKVSELPEEDVDIEFDKVQELLKRALKR